MRNKSFQFSFLVLVLVFFLGFTFVAPKTVRADALGDFISRMTLGDFIRRLFGLPQGSGGALPTPTQIPVAPMGYDCDSTDDCDYGYCCNQSSRCVSCTTHPAPTNTPRPTSPPNPTPTTRPTTSQPTNTPRPTTPPEPTTPPDSTPTPDGSCQYENLNACISDDCSRRGGNCTQQGCTSGRYRCNTPNPECQYENLNACISDDCSRRGGNCTQQGCTSGRYRCTISAPSATPTARPTNTPVPLPPTSTPRPGGATSTPGPTNTPVPLPPVNTPAPTNPVNTPCYYNVKLIDASGGALPSALQTGNTESGGCRTPGVRELVPSYYTQGSSSTNRPEWPCTDATYVGQNCTQGIVTGQFVCMGGPLHEIKGCYNRSSGAYQRVSVTSLGPTNTPRPNPTNTPPAAYGSFDEWTEAFRRYLYNNSQYPVSLSDLEDWRNNIPLLITPTPTPIP